MEKQKLEQAQPGRRCIWLDGKICLIDLQKKQSGASLCKNFVSRQIQCEFENLAIFKVISEI